MIKQPVECISWLERFSKAAAAEPSPQAPQPSARDIYTYGFRLKSKPGDLGHWVTPGAAGQFGNFQDARPGALTRRAGSNIAIWPSSRAVTHSGGMGYTALGLETPSLRRQQSL